MSIVLENHNLIRNNTIMPATANRERGAGDKGENGKRNIEAEIIQENVEKRIIEVQRPKRGRPRK